MRTNGLLYIEIRTSGGVNEYGEPIGDTTAWGDPIECSLAPNNDTRLGKYEDGEFRQASYTILVESQPLTAERIMLSQGGEQLGEYRVLSIRQLTTGRTQIIV